ncbi:50S ribosomal protein L23 [Candidatus Aerophobetes bacterium]|nr:50S ribosomal protein L23 [Candidatus Aerophobetes bacterium]
MNKSPYNIIISPVVTEKATDLQKEHVYIFKVPPEANKIDVKNAVEDFFNVKVEKVRTFHVRSKRRKWRGRVVGKTSQWKKAIVKLKEGYTIEKLGV